MVVGAKPTREFLVELTERKIVVGMEAREKHLSHRAEESLDFAAGWGIVGFTVNEPNSQARANAREVLRREARSIIDIESCDKPVLQDRVLEDFLQEQGIFLKPELPARDDAGMIVDDGHKNGFLLPNSR